MPKSLFERAVNKYRKKGMLGILAAVLRRISFWPMMMIRKPYRKIKVKFIWLYLRKRYDYVIQKYKNYSPPPSTENYLPEYNGVIWSMWWQGEEDAPAAAKLCLASIKKHRGSHKFIIITKYNYQEYLDLPEHIISKVNAGYISLIHLSDIIRVNLLAKYGGLWIDAGMFVANDLPDEIFLTEYYSIKYIKAKYNNLVSKCNWVIGFYAAHRNSCLFSFLAEMLAEYLKTHNSFVDYFLTDQIFGIAFKDLPEFYNEWSKIPYNNAEWYSLFNLFNEEWNSEEYSNITSSTIVLRLTYKLEYDTKTDSGKETFYGHLLSEYGITDEP